MLCVKYHFENEDTLKELTEDILVYAKKDMNLQNDQKVGVAINYRIFFYQ